MGIILTMNDFNFISNKAPKDRWIWLMNRIVAKNVYLIPLFGVLYACNSHYFRSNTIKYFVYIDKDICMMKIKFG